MALSVSGFPEPLRQNPADTDTEPSLLANNPMLRGLFGKKAESKPLSRQNTEESIPSSPSPSSSTPRTSQMLASADEQAFLAQMALQNPEPLPPISHQRQRQVSLTRRTPPPVKRQPSLGRLEIGSAPRGAPGGPPLHTLPKPPTVVVQEWKTQEPTLAHPRPLPAVPNPGPIIESSKTAAMRAAVAHRPPASKVIMTSPTRPRAQTTTPHAVSVRFQSMAVDLKETEGAPPSSSSTAATSSASSAGGSTSAIPNTNNNTTNTATPATLTQNQSQVRPLPRIPPASAVQPSPHHLPPHVPRPARVKRPKTSPSSSAGFGSAVRSPFDAVPSSWASRPVDLNPSQPVASTSAAGPSSHASTSSPSTSHQVLRTLPLPRPRSQSRPRRERSVEASGSGSRSAATSPVRRAPSNRFPVISRTPTTPTLNGMSTSPSSARRTPTRASGSGSGSGYSSSSPTTSPRLGHPPPNRFLTDRGTPTTAKIDEESASIRSQALDSSEAIGGGRPSTADSRPSHEHPSMSDIDADADADTDSGGPLGPFVDDLDHTSLLSRSPSPMRYARPSSRGSLSFSDDDYFSDTRSRSRSRSRHPGRGKQLRAFRHSYRAPPRNPERSPSPIAYARRRSLEVDVDMEIGLLAGEEGEGEGEDTPVDRKPPRRHTQPRSYQFDYKAAQEASPFLWNAGAGAGAGAGLAEEGATTTVKGGKEGKEKDKQKEKERKKAEKEARKSAGSVKSKRSKSKGSSRTNSHTNSLTHSIPSSGRPSGSRSPRGRRSVMGTPTGSVIDISSPTKLAGSYHELTLEKEKMPNRKDSKRGSKDKEKDKNKELRRLGTHNHRHKERTRTSFSGILPDVAMWGVGVKEKETGKEKEGAPSTENATGKAGGGWNQLVPLRRGSEPEWVGVGVGQLYESEKANAMVVAAIQRG